MILLYQYCPGKKQDRCAARTKSQDLKR